MLVVELEHLLSVLTEHGVVIRFIFIFICASGIVAQTIDAPSIPTLEERFQMLMLQRDVLLKEVQLIQLQDAIKQASSNFDTEYKQLAEKYNCANFNADFTCIKK